MQYIVSFLEGIITFISPCLLPLLPVYIAYFAGGRTEDRDKRKTLRNALGFVSGFTLVFVLLGAFAGTIGALLRQHAATVNLFTGFIVVAFGLSFLGILNIGFLTAPRRGSAAIHDLSFGSSLLFGVVFSIGWTPCVGVFLGSALLLASQQASTVQGILMLLSYSFGLGIPFIASALLIERLKSTFHWIKSHYVAINRIAGLSLVLLGLLMMGGYMSYFLSIPLL